MSAGDFGIARSQSTGTNMLRTLVGTPFYLSPELCDDKPYNSAADIWAIGVCLVRSPTPSRGLHDLPSILNLRPGGAAVRTMHGQAPFLGTE